MRDWPRMVEELRDLHTELGAESTLADLARLVLRRSSTPRLIGERVFLELDEHEARALVRLIDAHSLESTVSASDWFLVQSVGVKLGKVVRS